jgi:hypothetical protein
LAAQGRAAQNPRIGTYVALSEIASDRQAETFVTTHAYIALKSGLSPRTIASRLPELAEIGLVEISTPIMKAPSTYKLLPVPQPLPNDMQRTKTASLQALEESKEESLEESPKKGGENPPARNQKRAVWQLLKDEKEVEKRLSCEWELGKKDRDIVLIDSLKAQLRKIHDEMKGANT